MKLYSRQGVIKAFNEKAAEYESLAVELEEEGFDDWFNKTDPLSVPDTDDYVRFEQLVSDYHYMSNSLKKIASILVEWDVL